tara:strand:- start:588 stop:797 length:210 start_codon:yes stop_codon:yes gene_type:complete
VRDIDLNPLDSTKLQLLRERHQTLDDEIDEANKKIYLSAREQMRIKELKVRRLRLRDLITQLEEEGDGS